MKCDASKAKDRSSGGLEENLKKALTELMILFLFGEGEHYIGELTLLLEKRSHGALTIVFPYAAIYRLSQAGYLIESKKKNAPDGRLRQYYKITEKGQDHLEALLNTYQNFIQGVNAIFSGGE